MPHIVFDGKPYHLSEEGKEPTKARLLEAAKAGEFLVIQLTDPEDGDLSWLLWTPGVPITINDWDIPEPPSFDFPPMTGFGAV